MYNGVELAIARGGQRVHESDKRQRGDGDPTGGTEAVTEEDRRRANAAASFCERLWSGTTVQNWMKNVAKQILIALYTLYG
jgi:hypothetical protein